MDAAGKTAVVVAVISVTGAAVVALINMAPELLARTSATLEATAQCPQIPPYEDNAPQPRRGYVWSPADFRLTAAGDLELEPGHWERAKAEEHVYLPGHWDPDKETCVWIPGAFVPVDG